MSRRRSTLALVAALLAGPAAAAPPEPRRSAPTAASAAAAQRGAAIAAQRCAGCHALGSDFAARGPGPGFETIARRETALTLRKRFQQISAHGSGDMRARPISAEDAENLGAYLATLAP